MKEAILKRIEFWNQQCPAWVIFMKETGLPDEEVYPPLPNEDLQPILSGGLL